MGAGAAAVALMVRGARARRQRYSLLGAAAAGDDYDPLQRWLSSPTIKK